MKHLKHLFIVLCCIISFSFMLSTPTYAHTTYLRGIDVSEWEGTIDFEAVKASGIDIVYIRVAEGGNYEDRYWRSHYTGATDAGLKIGFYHYITATSIEAAHQQAQYFYDLIKDKNMDCYPVMDFESFGSLETATINHIATAYLETLESLIHVSPMVYSDAYNTANLWDKSLSKYPLWVANYGVSEPETIGIWDEWVGFQYSDSGTINGINDPVDLDYFKESVFLAKDSKPSTMHATSHQATHTITYIIQPGDTLWQIAMNHHTTIAKLVSYNHITNPNLIYPGQSLLIPTTSNTHTSTHTPSPSISYYTVQSGDTLWQIAMNHHTTISTLATLNHLNNPNLIYPGQILKIPN